MADSLTDLHDRLFTTRNLEWAYRTIVEILDRFEIPATFAFVACFADTKENFAAKRASLLRSPAHAAWLWRLFIDLDRGVDEGWFLPSALAIVRESRVPHEIASHGYSHLPLDSAQMDENAWALELNGIREWSRQNGVNLTTFVYPRNAIGEPARLRDMQIRGYREAPVVRGGSRFSRIRRLAGEFLPHGISQTHGAVQENGLVPIPGDFFMNWRSGARSLVPIPVTVGRLASALDHAVAHNGIVHLWLHPHNLLTGRNQAQLFERCMREIRRFQARGSIQVATQADYCNALAGG